MEEAGAYAKVAAKLNLAAGIIFGVCILILLRASNEMNKEERYRGLSTTTSRDAKTGIWPQPSPREQLREVSLIINKTCTSLKQLMYTTNS